MSTDPITRDLVEMVRLTRDVERDVFGAIPPELRDRPLRPGDWSPKDHQAHLSAWKERQADRLAAVRRSDAPSYITDAETDAVNADLQRLTADAAWEEVVRRADEASTRLAGELAATDAAVVSSSAHELIGSTFGNSSYHAAQHVRWLQEAGIPVDRARFRRFVSDLADLARRSSLPERDRSVLLYNAACYAAVDGDLAMARELLPDAFGLDAELIAVARGDPDLLDLRDELAAAEGQ